MEYAEVDEGLIQTSLNSLNISSQTKPTFWNFEFLAYSEVDEGVAFQMMTPVTAMPAGRETESDPTQKDRETERQRHRQRESHLRFV